MKKKNESWATAIVYFVWKKGAMLSKASFKKSEIYKQSLVDVQAINILPHLNAVQCVHEKKESRDAHFILPNHNKKIWSERENISTNQMRRKKNLYPQ